ncbi:Endothelin-converting enzyme 2 [Borealophlyctis nickersoniae]|nr:Endothelin-converting enzyme 2 [Borealophlyctis nickersoniae]
MIQPLLSWGILTLLGAAAASQSHSHSSSSADVLLAPRDEALQPLITVDFPHSLGPERLDSWLDKSTHPCDDFYQFACGGFMKKYKKLDKDVLELMQESNTLLMEQILNQTSDALAKTPLDKGLFDKTRTYYDSCLDASIIEKRGFEPIIPLAKRVIQNTDPSSPLSLPALFGQLHKDGIYTVFKTAYTKVENGSPKDLRLQFLAAPAYEVTKDTVKLVLQYFVENKVLELPKDTNLNDVAEWVLGLEKEGIKFVNALNIGQKASDGLRPDQFLSISDLTAATGLNWTDYTASVSLAGVDKLYFWGDASTWVASLRSVSVFKPSDLRYYFLWRLGVAHFNKLSKQYWNLWSTRIYPGAVRASIDDPNDQGDVFQYECVTETGVHMNYLSGHLFVKYAFNETQRATATKLISELVDAFRTKIQSIGWMDLPTKQAALAKLDNMVKIVGYPDWLTDASLVDAYYKDLKFDRTKYFENAVAAQVFADFAPSRHQIGKDFERANLYFGYPWQLNAFHLTDYVQIQINPGILQRPLFSTVNPSAMNYGSLGTIIGHEITHAFDSTGYKLDKDGILQPWWTPFSTQQFHVGAQCFEDQYNKYQMGFTDGGVVRVHGKRTLGENIADNGGMDVALTAWLHAIGGVEKARSKAEGFGGWTWEQVFFLSFGQTWCSAKDEASTRFLLENDVHAPNPVRVRGVLHNSPEFARAFGCPIGSPMNPTGDEGRCYLY